MLRTLAVLWWIAFCQKFNITVTQEPSCLLQIQPDHEETRTETCKSTSSWTPQLLVEPRPAYPKDGWHQATAALRNNFALMGWSQTQAAPNLPASVLMYSVEENSGWRLNANLTALANSTEMRVLADLSSANIAIFYQARGDLPLNVYSFAYDGTSWNFVNLEVFPKGNDCFNAGGCLRLGGNLMVFRPEAATNDVFQTFQWQGASWSLVPTANLTSPPAPLPPSFAVDGQRLVLFTFTISATDTADTVRTVPVLSLYEWAGNSWSGPVANFTSFVSERIEEPVGVALDGNYMLAATRFPSPLQWSYIAYIFIYEHNDGSWEEVYRQEVGEVILDVDISSSGKAAVAVESGRVFRVLFFERGADDAWGPTQTLVLNRAKGDVEVGIGGAAAVVASFVSDGNDRYNTTTNGRIIGCNATVPTTPMPSYRYSYYQRFRRPRCPTWCAIVHGWIWWCRQCTYRYSYYQRFRRPRCPKWCAIVHWWIWWCRQCT